jgi:hypothetical protein
MANYDVVVTNAKAYHDPLIDNKKRLALLIYAKAIDYILTIDYTTAAGQKLIVSNAVKALAGMPKAEFPLARSPQEVAIWFKFAESGNVGLAQASLPSKLAAIPYWLNCDEEVLAKTDVFITGVILGILT